LARVFEATARINKRLKNNIFFILIPPALNTLNQKLNIKNQNYNVKFKDK
jgi:hypothetical protein